MLKTYLLALLSLACLLSGAAGQCSNIVVTNDWQFNYQADLIDVAPIAINGLNLILYFHNTVDNIDYWQGTATRVDGSTWTLTDTVTNVGAGEEIRLSFQVTYSGPPPLVVTEDLNGVSLCESGFSTVAPMQNPCDATGMTPYDYSQALCMSYLFFEAQRSGPLPLDQRVTWRFDSALDDGSDVGKDLAGGYYDAGDHVKFGFPMAYTATVLAWGLIDFVAGHDIAGQTDYGKAAVKWATDYFLKAHTATNELYGQVGDGTEDHNYWGRPEDMTMARPSAKIDEAAPGSDLAGETAAALAAAAIVFQDSDPAYASQLLTVAAELYDFADNFRELYHVSIPGADAFYHSWSGYGDELAWAALWLYRATNDVTYLDRAKGHWVEFNMADGLPVQFSWDDKKAGVLAMFSLLDGGAEYTTMLGDYLAWLKNGATYTPEGLVFLDTWGANRHAANVAFISLFAAAKLGMDPATNQAWAQGQMNQLLGDNARHQRSFVVGFGVNPPQRPHHRSSSCPNYPVPCTRDFALLQPGPNPQVLYGALVGGPTQAGDYEDDRENYINNEVACDYNAAFSGALAALVELS